MSFAGTFMNGVVILDGSPRLPQGTRVCVELAPDADEDFDPPPEPVETHEEYIESLRQSCAESEAGIPLAEAMARISAEFNLPPISIE